MKTLKTLAERLAMALVLLAGCAGLFAIGFNLLFQPADAEAGGGIDPDNVVSELRTQNFDYYLQFPTRPDGGGDTTIGKKGVIVASTAGDAAVLTVTRDGGTVAPLPYPSKLTVSLTDDAADSTLTCTSVTITGANQFGAPISETLTSMTETAQTTSAVFERVESVVTAGCLGGNNASDRLWVATTQIVGLPLKVKSQKGLARNGVNICILDQSSTNDAYCWQPEFILSESTTGSFDTDNYAVDCARLPDAGVNPALALAQGDICQIRARAPGL